jgi:hypothetical protein
MLSFYNFYTTFTFLIGIGSSIALGFIIKDYHQVASDSCDVSEYKITYNMYQMILFLLISTIFTSIIQLIGYCCFGNNDEIYDNENKNSVCKKIITIVQILLFLIKCMFVIPMLIKFNNHKECVNFYKDNNMCILATFFGLIVSYILEIFMVFILIITYCVCNKKHSSYEPINNY